MNHDCHTAVSQVRNLSPLLHRVDFAADWVALDAGGVLARAGARMGGAFSSIFVSGWLPAAVVADDPPAFLVDADPNTGVLVLAAVLLLALPMARRQPSDPIQ